MLHHKPHGPIKNADMFQTVASLVLAVVGFSLTPYFLCFLCVFTVETFCILLIGCRFAIFGFCYNKKDQKDRRCWRRDEGVGSVFNYEKRSL